MDSLNIELKSFFRCIGNRYKNDEINDKSFRKSPTRGINSLALSTSESGKTLVGNIKDEISSVFQTEPGQVLTQKRLTF